MDKQSTFSIYTSTEDSVIRIDMLDQNKSLSNSFTNRTFVIISENDIDLDNYKLQGVYQELATLEITREFPASEATRRTSCLCGTRR